ncbi:AsnC family transcriptional regulator [Acrocarpospora pleiomorpha]|uniref:AsnC family transcriptional regulator n=1 Tax=Acrocarpospora pleiomorpha TaxID=90975 RepID=A0A5M3XMC5_9ACTN|nr:AsnC family transcriptional regulator [Acrocarpospora pleiomorpha]GES20791.1 AsnC family transcriptional regulator [Acrocarpospora pleiomorpha]
MASASFDELDIAIVDAVRSAPRANWRELASPLGVDPATVGRRWSRMESGGAAWVTAHLSGSATPACAMVEVDCAPGRSIDVAHVLADDTQAATVKLASGGRDILMLAQAPTLDLLADYLLNVVGHVPGIASVRSHVITRSALEASRWREGALSLEQRRRLRSNDQRRAGAGDILHETDIGIVNALQTDGRMSFERLAEHVGISPVSVRRRLSRMQEAGLVTFRCDISPQLSGRSVSAVYFGSMDIHDLRNAEERIRALPGVRAFSFVSGPFNVIVDASLRSIAEVHDLELTMSQALPALHIQDRSVVLRMIKLLGRVLDAEGRSARCVPLVTRT